MNKKVVKRVVILMVLVMAFFAIAVPAYAATSDAGDAVQTEQAADNGASNVISTKALASGIAIGIAAGLGAIAMAIAVGHSVNSISRQPEADGKIRTTLMLGLVFIETAIIYALLVVIMIIFVL